VLEEGDVACTRLPESVVFHPRTAKLEAATARLLARGGMPGVWDDAMDEEEVREELETYTALFLEQDLADLARLRDLEPYITLQRLVAERTADLLNASELARDAGISHQTARSYLRYLELSFQVVLLRPWFANRSKRLVRSPKIHWLDAGVWRSVTRRWDGLPGELYESAVVAEFLKILDASRTPWEPHHLRTHDGMEIDLLLTRGERVISVGIRKADRATPADARHLRRTPPPPRRPGRPPRTARPPLGERLWAAPDVLLFGERAETRPPSSR